MNAAALPNPTSPICGRVPVPSKGNTSGQKRGSGTQANTWKQQFTHFTVTAFLNEAMPSLPLPAAVAAFAAVSATLHRHHT